jgi:hypothetical protein
MSHFSRFYRLSLKLAHENNLLRDQIQNLKHQLHTVTCTKFPPTTTRSTSPIFSEVPSHSVQTETEPLPIPPIDLSLPENQMHAMGEALHHQTTKLVRIVSSTLFQGELRKITFGINNQTWVNGH